MRTLDDETLGAYADGELPREERERVAKILAEDVEARRRLGDIRWVSVLAAAAWACHARVPNEARRAGLPRGGMRRWRRRVALLPAALAVGMTAGYGLGSFLHDPASPPTWEARARAFHAYYEGAGEGRDRDLLNVTGDAHEAVQSWLERRLGHAVPVPDLTSLGLSLEGARLWLDDATPVAQILYQGTDGRVLSLVVKASEPGRPGRRPAARAARTVEWAQGRWKVAVVGAFEERELRTIGAVVSSTMR